MGSPTKTTWNRRDNRDAKLLKARRKKIAAAARKTAKAKAAKVKSAPAK